MLAVFAIALGLSNIAVSRLTQAWSRLPSKSRRQYEELERYLEPARNHRAYRMLIAKMERPIIPFVPLILKDLTFANEGNRSSYSGLVNYEKMHLIANVLRAFRNCKARATSGGIAGMPKKHYQAHKLIK